jgi:hypothetical protein
MRTPLVWLNLVLATILGLLYTQRDLFIPTPPPDLVFIAETPAGADVPDADIASGVQSFARDWNYRVATLVSDGSARSLATALKNAIAMAPKGISMPGISDYSLVLPFVTEAQRAGIRVTFHTRPLAEAERLYGHLGTGYAGASGQEDGELVAQTAWTRLKLEPGSVALVIGSETAPPPGSRAFGCMQGVTAAGGTAEYVSVPANVKENQLLLRGGALWSRISSDPRPEVIFWDAGAVERLTGMLESQGLEHDEVNVVCFSPVTALPQTEQLFVKYVMPERGFMASYLSLVQLHISTHYGAPGIHIPFGASL